VLQVGKNPNNEGHIFMSPLKQNVYNRQIHKKSKLINFECWKKGRITNDT
jgi:hypothetical protein